MRTAGGSTCRSLPTRARTPQTVLGKLIGSEYEYLMAEKLEGEKAQNVADACASAALLYGATLVLSCLCICTDRSGASKAGKE